MLDTLVLECLRTVFLVCAVTLCMVPFYALMRAIDCYYEAFGHPHDYD